VKWQDHHRPWRLSIAPYYEVPIGGGQENIAYHNKPKYRNPSTFNS